METFTLQELSYFLVMLIGSLGGLFHIVQKSRCTTIECCGMKCNRTPISKEEFDLDSTTHVPIDIELGGNSNKK